MLWFLIFYFSFYSSIHITLQFCRKYATLLEFRKQKTLQNLSVGGCVGMWSCKCIWLIMDYRARTLEMFIYVAQRSEKLKSFLEIFLDLVKSIFVYLPNRVGLIILASFFILLFILAWPRKLIQSIGEVIEVMILFRIRGIPMLNNKLITVKLVILRVTISKENIKNLLTIFQLYYLFISYNIWPNNSVENRNLHKNSEQTTFN